MLFHPPAHPQNTFENSFTVSKGSHNEKRTSYEFMSRNFKAKRGKEYKYRSRTHTLTETISGIGQTDPHPQADYKRNFKKLRRAQSIDTGIQIIGGNNIF